MIDTLVTFRMTGGPVILEFKPLNESGEITVVIMLFLRQVIN